MPKYTGRSRVCIITDFLPNEVLGPSTLAEKDFNAVRHLPEFECIFISSSVEPVLTSDLNLSIVRRNARVEFLMQRVRVLPRFHSFLSILFRFFYGVKLILLLLRLEPEYIVVHKVGTVFPYNTLVFVRLFSKKCFIVHHDFMLINRGKIYPGDLRQNRREIACYEAFLKDGEFKLGKGPRKDLGLTRRYIRGHTNFVYNAFQKSVMESNGVPIQFVTKQLVDPCSHKNIAYRPRASDNTIRILFVGRSIGKGLQDAFRLLESNEIFSISIISEPYTETLIPTMLKNSRVNFLGPKSQAEVFAEMHKSQIVFARSNCLEVGPLTVLESLAHGIPVLCSPYSGNSEIANKVDSRMIYFDNEDNPACRIINLVDSWDAPIMKKRFEDVYRLQPSVSLTSLLK